MFVDVLLTEKNQSILNVLDMRIISCSVQEVANVIKIGKPSLEMLYFDLRPGTKMLFQGDTPEGSDTFQFLPVIERDRVGGLRLMIWDKVKVPLCHYSDAPEESNL